MQIAEQRLGDVVVLCPAGRIDNDTSPEFQAKLLETVGKDSARVIVDAAEIEYISSAGLRALMMAAKQSKAKGGQLAIVALTPIVQEIFAISRFFHVVTVFGTRDEAAAAFA